MNKVRFSYLKWTAVVAVLAITLIGLSGLLSMTTMAQENITTPPREIDLRAKLKDKKFADGRRVEIHAFPDGDKIVAEIKNGEFLNWFLVASDGTEVQGVVKKKTAKDTLTSTCTETITTTTTTHRLIRKDIVTTQTTVVPIPCPLFDADTDK